MDKPSYRFGFVLGFLMGISFGVQTYLLFLKYFSEVA